MIELQNINKIFHHQPQPVYALNQINLTVETGKIVGLLGKSGAGKSTLLRCINLLEKPTSGLVRINGIDLTQLSISALRHERQKIGFIFQHYHLLQSKNVFDNIALPLKIRGCSSAVIQDRVSKLLSLTAMTEHASHFAHELSGGQKQRVAIARALAIDPTILLCDEITSALDAESTQTILNLIKKINHELGITVLLITHELDVAKQICHFIGVMNQGELIEYDSTLEVLLKPKRLFTKQLVQAQINFDWTKSTNTAWMVKFTFIGAASAKPLISSLVKRWQINVNIRQALIEKIQATTVGFTICELSGDEEALNQAIAYARTIVEVEVLHV